MAKRMKSDHVRTNWRDVLDYVRTGGTVIVEHYNRPVAQIGPLETAVTATDITNADPGRTHFTRSLDDMHVLIAYEGDATDKRIKIEWDDRHVPVVWITTERGALSYKEQSLLDRAPWLAEERRTWTPREHRSEQHARDWWAAEVTRLLRAGWTMSVHAPSGALQGQQIVAYDDGNGTLKGTAGRTQGTLGAWTDEGYAVVGAVLDVLNA